MFVDTAGWGAFFDRRERHHPAALGHLQAAFALNVAVVTTNFIPAELTGLLTSPLRIPKPQQIQLLTGLQTDPRITVVGIDPVLEARAWRLWAARADKDWTLVDCSSFVVMADRGLTDALTSDHHFDQAGFVRLLR